MFALDAVNRAGAHAAKLGCSAETDDNHWQASKPDLDSITVVRVARRCVQNRTFLSGQEFRLQSPCTLLGFAIYWKYGDGRA
jgi:hypothetical protein